VFAISAIFKNANVKDSDMESEKPADNTQDPAPEESTDFKRFATKRMAVGVLIALVVLWVATVVTRWAWDQSAESPKTAHVASETGHGASEEKTVHAAGETGSTHAASTAGVAEASGDLAESAAGAHAKPGSDHTPPAQSDHVSQPLASQTGHQGAQPSSGSTASEGGSLPLASGHGAGGHGAPEMTPSVKGVAFVDAVIKPMHHELYERFWGWRPNDILDFTDNVNNYQLGVLEVTRRTAVTLAERVSRAGSTESFDKNLENAMNWFMVSADRYWFPSPEGKYKDGLKELGMYRDRLKRGAARFWTRTDNLIPLLAAYEDLLGSCDENLVKAKEDDGSDVSFFAADDYFFYAKGVASALYEILHAIEKDFYPTIEARRGIEVLHHAIESCHHAMEIDPIVITNSSLSGILANHRANMAAPISHARFYLTVLIKTLST
jgi:hypothetical protein